MRVLFFTTFVSFQSGASHALLRTVRRVQACGVKPVVVVPDCPDSRDMFPVSTFEVLYLPIERPRRSLNPKVQIRYLSALPKTVRSLRRTLQDRDVDLVHFNEITDSIAGVVARSIGVPCICHVRSDCPPQPYRFLLLQALARTTEAIVVPSTFTAAWISDSSKKLASKLRLVYDYAFDESQLIQVSNTEFRREIGCPSEAILVVLVSKLLCQKGHECFIKAAEMVVRERSDVRFAIVGGAVPGHEAEAVAIQNMARKLDPHLRIAPPRPTLSTVYSAADFAVHCPTYPDPYPTVVLLSMLAGKAVIGSEIGGIPEQIRHEHTGLLVPPNSASSLAAAILRLADDIGLRHRIATDAKQKLTSEILSQSQGRLLVELYNSILGRRDSSALGTHTRDEIPTIV